MSNQRETDSRPLTDQEQNVVDRVCRDHDFPLRGARVRQDILALTPRTLDDLPDSDRMGQIAEALEAEGFRYVTFSVPDGPLEDEHGEES